MLNKSVCLPMMTQGHGNRDLQLIDGTKSLRPYIAREYLNGYGKNSSLKAIMLKVECDIANICHAQIVKYNILPYCGLTFSNKQVKMD